MLINHLRVEWAVNPQYAYGWAVPFLCAYLIWQRQARTTADNQETAGSKGGCSVFPFPALLAYLLFASLALLYAPIRLVQEANPEWRLISWALSMVVIGLTLLASHLGSWPGGHRSNLPGPLGEGENSPKQDFALGTPKPTSPLTPALSPDGGEGEEQAVHGESVLKAGKEVHPGPALGSHPAGFLRPAALFFPLAFFLVAVPWPTLVEGPLIQALSRANAGAVIELLNGWGVPAIQHGNTIEISTGVVGIDEACSGIRSFQATLMISLFLGDLYRFGLARRSLLCFSGFFLAFVFNVGRTFLLTLVAARKGLEAIARWHDPAGVTILLACFGTLWLLALALRRRPGPDPERGHSAPLSERVQPGADKRAGAPGLAGPAVRFWPASSMLGLLAVWLLVVDAGLEVWYRAHEWKLPRATEWTVHWPTNSPGFRTVPPSEKSLQLLRYDEGINAVWEEGDGTHWQAIFFRWNPGRTAAHLAKSHTPDACMRATGRTVVPAPDLKWFNVQGLQLPFRSYLVEEGGHQLHVFYCHWEDRGQEQGFQRTHLTYGTRLEHVLAGRRHLGQRSLELIFWGLPKEQKVEELVQAQLEKLLRVAEPPAPGRPMPAI